MSYIVLFTDKNGDPHAFGPYRSFKRADSDAREWGNSLVLPIEGSATIWENRHLQKVADRIDGYDRDDLGESPDY